MTRSLCAPDRRKSCFACCPPIRPAGYEHIQHASAVKRMLRENTRSFQGEKARARPITGFSCWALGYLDPGFRLVGCLLHPAGNGGRDLRNLVGYGEKCRRESCPEARVFERLGPEAKAWLLALTRDLDAFSYSSREKNPLFRLLGWGHGLWNRLTAAEPRQPESREDFYHRYPFFRTGLSPRAHAYLLMKVAERDPLVVKSHAFQTRFEALSRELMALAPRSSGSPCLSRTYTHLLDLPQDFKDFLRLHLGMRKTSPEAARRVMGEVDGRVAWSLRGKSVHWASRKTLPSRGGMA